MPVLRRVSGKKAVAGWISEILLLFSIDGVTEFIPIYRTTYSRINREQGNGLNSICEKIMKLRMVCKGKIPDVRVKSNEKNWQNNIFPIRFVLPNKKIKQNEEYDQK